MLNLINMFMHFAFPNHVEIYALIGTLVIDSSCRSVSISGRLVMQCSVSDWRSYRAVREERHRKLVTNVKRNAAKNVCLLK